jgi:hypothetical protein
MWEDPIVAEVHRIRQAIMAEFDNDLEAYFRYIQRVEEAERKRGVRYVEGPLHKGREVKPDAA